MEFKLWVLEQEEAGCLVFMELPEELRAALGEQLKEHAFILKTPLNEGLRQAAERRLWVPNGVGGMMRDETLLPMAYTLTFLKHWTLKETLDEEGYKSLSPNLSQAIYQQVNVRVFPSHLNSDFFLEALKKTQTSS